MLNEVSQFDIGLIWSRKKFFEIAAGAACHPYVGSLGAYSQYFNHVPQGRVRMGRILRFGSIAALAATALLYPLGATQAQDKIVLRAITPWPMSYYWCEPLNIFTEMVHERLGDRVEVRNLGGAEIVPPFEQVEALRNGVVDVALAASSYYTGQVPEALAVLYTRKSPSELRESGFYDAMREIHMDKAGVVYLANVGGSPGTAFRFFTNTPVEKPDFTGLRLRVTPVYTEFVSELGGTPVSMAPGDVYTAMERGVVNGYGWSYGGLTDYAWHEVTKYVIDHPFFTANTAILFNSERWESLPDDIRSELEEIAIEVEQASAKAMAAYEAEEDGRLAELGLEFIHFSDEDAERFLNTAYNVAWREFNAQHPELGPSLRKMAE